MTSDTDQTELYSELIHAGFTVLARELNERFPDRPQVITRQQVHTWYTRRTRNGFPKAYRVLAPSGKIKNLFYRDEVMYWYESYVPGRGGKTRMAAVDAPVSGS